MHVGVDGLVITLVLARTRLPRARRWAITLASGCWAVVPDRYHPAPGTRSWYKPLPGSAYANLFWLQRAIDRLDRPGYAVVVFAAVSAVVIAVEWGLGRSSGEGLRTSALGSSPRLAPSDVRCRVAQTGCRRWLQVS